MANAQSLAVSSSKVWPRTVQQLFNVLLGELSRTRRHLAVDEAVHDAQVVDGAAIRRRCVGRHQHIRSDTLLDLLQRRAVLG